MPRTVISEASTREAVATTPYNELSRGSQEHLLLRLDLREVLEVAAAQEPPNSSIIYAIHGGVTQRLCQIEAKGHGLVLPRGEYRDYLEQVYSQATNLEARLA